MLASPPPTPYPKNSTPYLKPAHVPAHADLTPCRYNSAVFSTHTGKCKAAATESENAVKVSRSGVHTCDWCFLLRVLSFYSSSLAWMGHASKWQKSGVKHSLICTVGHFASSSSFSSSSSSFSLPYPSHASAVPLTSLPPPHPASSSPHASAAHPASSFLPPPSVLFFRMVIMYWACILKARKVAD